MEVVSARLIVLQSPRGSAALAHDFAVCSFRGHELRSLLFFPLALIMAYVAKNRRGAYVR